MNISSINESFSDIRLPNAWLSRIEKLAQLLDNVYTNTIGEIWLYNNDLAVFKDHRPNGAFKILYQDRIDGSLASRIKSIKILVNRTLYEKHFLNIDKNSDLFKNLCNLSENRLRTFYVGCLEDITPKLNIEFGGEFPWIFYLSEERLTSKKGVIILRPDIFPLHEKDDYEDIAIAWRLGDDELEIMKNRLIPQWVDKVFNTNVLKNFKSIEPIVSEKNVKSYDAIEKKVEGFKLSSPHSDKEIDKIHINILDKGLSPIVPPIDCGIVTTLDVEFEAVVERFNLVEVQSGQFRLALGWHINSSEKVSIVMIQSPEAGSVSSAIATMMLHNSWFPNSIFLLGICAVKNVVKSKNKKKKNDNNDDNEKRNLNDIIVSKLIHAYEYGELKQNPEDTSLDEIISGYEVRQIHPSKHLLSAAKSLLGKKLDLQDCPKNWELLKYNSNVYLGSFLCGSKVVKADVDWFEKMGEKTGDRKIIAVEMESEGVGNVCEVLDTRFLMIKGVSDFADGDKKDKHHNSSSQASVQFLYNLLSLPGIHKRLIK